MVLETEQLAIIQILSNVLLFIMGGISFFYVMVSLPQRKRRWKPYRSPLLLPGRHLPAGMVRLLFIKSNKAMEERKQLLLSCGMMLEPIVYEVYRRMLLIMLIGISLLGYFALERPALFLHMNGIYAIAGGVSLWIVVYFDRKLLEQLKAMRAQRIVKEIYSISHQLLYYADSNMNLHSKLSRCLQHTRTIRPAVETMLNEWYQDAEGAIRSFKQRLGTDEAYSFGETLNALRLHEDDNYYELLRQRIQDYKEKIDLAKESTKETVSYALFILAGLPILNTFRIFMYPWVVEGQQLFNSIN